MAASHSGACMIAVVIVTIFSLIANSAAQEAPAPAPASSAGITSPSFAAACVFAVMSFVFGSALRI